MEEQMFITEITDHVAFITMQAPQNNLMTAEFFVEYEKTMQNIENLVEKGEISGLIISGKGRHFSVGADVPS
ncbi:MAG: enoyl-CoA hydratase/isomerase family protein, partial [Ruminococcus sp.]|nr:enoyl-CoA hydratase/isomerase family protein [Ruminococcus sp.]